MLSWVEHKKFYNLGAWSKVGRNNQISPHAYLTVVMKFVQIIIIPTQLSTAN